MQSRKEAREYFMQLLYQMEIQKDFRSDIKERFLSQYMENSTKLEYFNHMYEIINLHLNDIDKVLTASSANWKIERIAKVDLAILRLSIAEILYFDEIPDSVSINEAVDLAKKYGSEDSGKFVNGILGKIVSDKNG